MKLRKLTHTLSLSASAEQNPPKQKSMLRTHPQVHTSSLLRRRMKLRFTVKLISSFILLIAVDQLSKYLIRFRHPADGGFYACNKNIAFGIEIPGLLFWIFWLAIIVIMITFAFRQKYIIYNTLYIILIVSGALSNAIDRLYFGCVIDFIDLKFWPVFNLADVFIVSGAMLLLAKYLKSYYNNKQNIAENTK